MTSQTEHRILLNPTELRKLIGREELSPADYKLFIYIATNATVFTQPLPLETDFNWRHPSVSNNGSSMFLFNMSREDISNDMGYGNIKTVSSRLKRLEDSGLINRFPFIAYRQFLTYMVKPDFFTVIIDGNATDIVDIANR